MNKLGVVIVGVNGAVASTLIAGVELMVKGLAPLIGMVTEKGEEQIAETITNLLDLAPLESIVFGGWDLAFKNVYEAQRHHKVFTGEQLEPVKAKLESLTPWPAVFASAYAENCKGDNIVHANGFREQLAILESHIEAFKQKNGLTRVVMVNLASTESFLEVQDVHKTLEAFEKGLDKNDPAISPAMRYFYLANKLG